MGPPQKVETAAEGSENLFAAVQFVSSGTWGKSCDVGLESELRTIADEEDMSTL